MDLLLPWLPLLLPLLLPQLLPMPPPLLLPLLMWRNLRRTWPAGGAFVAAWPAGGKHGGEVCGTVATGATGLRRSCNEAAAELRL